MSSDEDGNACCHIELWKEGDNLNEIYDGLFALTNATQDTILNFSIQIPISVARNMGLVDSSTYTLRQPESTSQTEKMRQLIEQLKQQMLDNSAE